jgi:thiamine pyridinylase
MPNDDRSANYILRAVSWRAVCGILGAALVVAGCGGSSPAAALTTAPPPSNAAPTPFRAVLFPYIPDSVGDNFQSLIQDLESGFEAQNPSIDLQVIIDPNMDLYDFAPGGTLDTLLGSGPAAAQVVEVDTLLMGTLTANHWVQPIQMTNPGVFATAWQAATIAGVVYGAPTYLCSNVVYSFQSVAGSTNATNLISRLTAIKPGITPLVGNYKGSWTLPSFYVDAWADTNGTAGMATSYNLPLDQKTMSFFPTIVNSCVKSAKNPCLDGSYADTEAETLFANGLSNGFIGYTERLFYIRSANPSAPLPSVITDPIGGGTHPSMFVDALVFNPNCTDACLTTAQAFASYMSTVSVRNLIAFSLDGPAGTIPRYLLQANQSFYAAAPASRDPMYQAYLPFVQVAQPFPNTNFPQARTSLNAALTAWFTGDSSSSPTASSTAQRDPAAPPSNAPGARPRRSNPE